MDLATFKSTWPDFVDSTDPQIQAMLDFATAEHDPTVWGSQLDHGIGLWTAHLLTVSPSGKASRLQAKEIETPYSALHSQLLEARTAGLRVF